MPDETLGVRLVYLGKDVEAYIKWYELIAEAKDDRQSHCEGALEVLEKIQKRLAPIVDEFKEVATGLTGFCPCGQSFEQNTGRGRKKKFCSKACKQKSVRDSKTFRLKASQPRTVDMFWGDE